MNGKTALSIQTSGALVACGHAAWQTATVSSWRAEWSAVHLLLKQIGQAACACADQSRQLVITYLGTLNWVVLDTICAVCHHMVMHGHEMVIPTINSEALLPARIFCHNEDWHSHHNTQYKTADAHVKSWQAAVLLTRHWSTSSFLWWTQWRHRDTLYPGRSWHCKPGVRPCNVDCPWIKQHDLQAQSGPYNSIIVRARSCNHGKSAQRLHVRGQKQVTKRTTAVITTLSFNY